MKWEARLPIRISITLRGTISLRNGGLKVQVLPVQPGPRKRKQKSQRRGQQGNHKPRPVKIDWDEVNRRVQEAEQSLPETEKRAREARAREEAQQFPLPEPSPEIEELKRLYSRRPLK